MIAPISKTHTDNIICYTQDISGEREWINKQFPNFINLETKSSGKWNTVATDGNYIREIPYTDMCDLDSIKHINGCSYKTVYNNSIDLIINDNNFMAVDHIMVNKDIVFVNNSNTNIKNYMMFTFARCGTVFIESILRKKYPAIHPHYALTGLDKPDIIKNFCFDPGTLICLNYRLNWWDWLTSQIITERNNTLTPSGVLHYSDNVDWDQLTTNTISIKHFDTYETYLINTFNLWLQLRVILPTHQFKLFRFEEVLPVYKTKSNHKKIPYDKTKLILNYYEAKKIFESDYLPRWKQLEYKALEFLNQLGVLPTINI